MSKQLSSAQSVHYDRRAKEIESEEPQARWVAAFNRACDKFLIERVPGYKNQFNEISERAKKSWAKRKL
jgi:hypothetical protein